MSKKTKPKDLQHRVELDAIRIIAILFVVTIHVVMPYINYPPFFGTNTWWLISIINACSRVAVPLFIMISGILALTKNEDTLNFYKKKLIRILLPLLFWSAVYFAWRKFFWGHYIPLEKVGQDLWEGTTTYHLYFLYIIAGLYAITPLLRRHILNIPGVYKKWLIVGFFAFGMGYYLVNDYVFPILKIALLFFLPYIGYYYAGHYLEKISLKKFRLLYFFIFYILLAMLTAYLNFVNMKSLGWNNTSINISLNRYFLENLSINNIALSVMAFVFFINFFKRIKLQHRVSEKITMISLNVFGVYLVHPIIIDLIDRYTKFTVGVIGHFVLISILFKIALTFIASFLTIIALRKIRLLQYVLG